MTEVEVITVISTRCSTPTIEFSFTSPINRKASSRGKFPNVVMRQVVVTDINTLT